jgi:hypothetical protein
MAGRGGWKYLKCDTDFAACPLKHGEMYRERYTCRKNRKYTQNLCKNSSRKGTILELDKWGTIILKY